MPQEYIKKLAVGQLPSGWNAVPLAQISQMVFSEFAAAGGLVLEVPSVVLPEESNFILNPNTPHFEKVRVESIYTAQSGQETCYSNLCIRVTIC